MHNVAPRDKHNATQRYAHSTFSLSTVKPARDATPPHPLQIPTQKAYKEFAAAAQARTTSKPPSLQTILTHAYHHILHPFDPIVSFTRKILMWLEPLENFPHLPGHIEKSIKRLGRFPKHMKYICIKTWSNGWTTAHRAKQNQMQCILRQQGRDSQTHYIECPSL